VEQGCVQNEAPDWSQLDVELDCPRCGYNLKMLTRPRCPECGLQFRWDELIEAEKESHTRPPIFEYHWRDHPIRSFSLTVSMCLQPRRLWRWLPLTAVPVVGVMPFLFVVVLSLLALLSLSQEYLWHSYNQLMYWSPSNFQGFPWLSWFDEILLPKLFVPSMVVVIVWFSIQVFRQTITRYRIRQSHILRVVFYSWIGLVATRFTGHFVLTVLALSYHWAFLGFLPAYDWLARIVDNGSLIILLLSLGWGLHSYLRVRGGWVWAILLLVFTSAVIIVIGLIVSVVVLDTFDNTYWKWLGDWSHGFSFLHTLASRVFLSLHGY